MDRAGAELIVASPSADRPLLPEAPAIHEVRLAVRAWLGAHPTAAVTDSAVGWGRFRSPDRRGRCGDDAVHVVIVDHRLTRFRVVAA
ncbi:tRNA(Ile)-lysidine synthetase, partial [Rhodococcus sp. IITR03]